MLRNLKQFNLPELEEKVLKFWKENKIFDKALKLRQGAEKFRFFEGPPTANGRPGIHHVLSRALKDIILRYKTMRGYFVRRQAGWDTHGLPVEIETENTLGLKQKQDIEKFGIAEFNEKAKALVWKYLDEWERLTDRIGFWLDMKNPYITYANNYIESLWWIFSQIAKRKLLTRSFKVVPWCPRCQTPLSSHELGQPGAYQKVKDPSVYIKFELLKPSFSASRRIRTGGSAGKRANKEYLLVWTTTPWTLPSNVAIAVNPQLTYTKYKVGNEYLWSYNPPPVENFEVIEKISGKKLIGLGYKPLFNVKGPWLKNKNFFKVFGADFVETAEGTGLVHIAPAFGEDDMNLIREALKVKNYKLKANDIPITINEQGIVQKACLPAGRDLPGAGKFAKEADKDILRDLLSRKLLLHHDAIEHDYPFCWRCASPLLYFARFSWFIEMSKLRGELLKNNEKINWIPFHVKDGRFGEWLREVKDWAISRDRYWGTPLPIWQCQKCQAEKAIGSLEDLNKWRYSGNKFWILRHGEADHNLKELIAAGPENGKAISNLTRLGIQQIEQAAKDLLKQLGKEKLHLIVTSPYLRTKTVAKIVAKATKTKIAVDKRFEEINTGIFNNRPILEHRKFFDKPLEQFTKTPPGGENLIDVKKRMLGGLLELDSKYDGKNILIVSHGDPLWVLEGAVKNFSNEEILKMNYIKPGELRRLDLNNWPYNLLTASLDLHRPYIDKIYLKCPECKGKMVRVKEVADVWFDSGAMPFAQFHYPFSCEAKSPCLPAGRQKPKAKSLEDCIDFPADYIAEAVDQTRGWFYVLLAVSTALELGVPYLNVICHGLVLDKNGQKMSKSKGNVVDPWAMVKKYGADIVRWYFYTVNPPGESKWFDEADLGKMLRKFIMLIYNSFVFLDTYGVKESRMKNEELKNVLDKWILARLNQTIQEVTSYLEKYDVGGAGKAIEVFSDDLSRWYIRRSRRRFQKPQSQGDLEIASAVLNHSLFQLSKLMAPFTPFFGEALYKSLQASSFRHQESVHLEDWPEAKKDFIDAELLEKMEEVRRLASLVLALRAEKGIKVRQPLNLLAIKNQKLNAKDNELLEILKDEVNVKEIKFNSGLKEEINLDIVITPELKQEGLVREFIRLVQGLRQDAGYIPKDIVVVMVETGVELGRVLETNADFIKKEVGAKTLELRKSAKFDAELNSQLDDQPIWVGLRKI